MPRIVVNGPTRDEIRDALFPPATVLGLIWLTFTIEEDGKSVPLKLAMQGVLARGGCMWTLICSDGNQSSSLLYNVETKRGLVRD